MSLSLSLSLVHINLHTQQVFRPPLDDYNVLIHLHKRHLPFAHQAVDTMETGSSHKSHDHKRLHPTHLPVVNFNPVQIYLQELEVYGAKLSCSLMIGEFFLKFQAAFSEFCLFFYDAYGGEFIAVVWKSQAFQPQSFKVLLYIIYYLIRAPQSWICTGLIFYTD